MLAAALMLVSAASPLASAAGLSASSAFAGALAGDTTVADPLDIPLEQMTRSQLKAEWRRLEYEKPGLGLPITLIALGGAGIFVSALTELYAALLSLASAIPTSVYLVAGIVLVGSGALLAVGIVVLLHGRGERQQYSDRMDDITRRLEQMDNGQTAPDYGSPPPPPPPPMLPPSAGLEVPPPSILVATF